MLYVTPRKYPTTDTLTTKVPTHHLYIIHSNVYTLLISKIKNGAKKCRKLPSLPFIFCLGNLHILTVDCGTEHRLIKVYVTPTQIWYYFVRFYLLIPMALFSHLQTEAVTNTAVRLYRIASVLTC